MNYVISIINPSGLEVLSAISEAMRLPLSLVLHGKGTATKSMLDLLGIEQKERRIVMTVIPDDKQAKEYIKEHKRRLYVDAPGNGIVISVPIKSVGGKKTLSFISSGQPQKNVPTLNYDFELILAITNEGHAEAVMDAARAAGAKGGTLMHAKGTGAKNAEKFFQVSIAQEKDLILIVSRAEEKAEIMRSILKLTGPDTAAGSLVFSLPISDIAGFSVADSE